MQLDVNDITLVYYMQQYVDGFMMKYQQKWHSTHGQYLEGCPHKVESWEEGGGCHMNIIISVEGNYSLPSTLTYLCCPCLVTYALFVFTALLSTHV